MAEKSHANQRKNRGPQVLKDIPLRNWCWSELEHQLNTMDIVFTNRDKVTGLIRKLEKANFAPSSLGDDRGKNRDRRRPRPSLRPGVLKSQVEHIVSLPMNQSQGKAVVPIWMILRTFCNLLPVQVPLLTLGLGREK